MYFNQPTVLGLDVQPNGIRFIKLNRKKTRFHINLIIAVDFAETVFVDGKIKHWGALSAAVEKVVQAHHLQGFPVAIHLPVSLVHMERIPLSKSMSDLAIKEEIEAYLQRDCSLSEALVIDFTRSPSVHVELEEISFIATRREYLNQYVECIDDAGLVVKIVDVDIYVLRRVMSHVLNLNKDSEQIFLVLYLNPQKITAILFGGQDILFHQQWEIGQRQEDWIKIHPKINIFLNSFSQYRVNQIIIAGNHPDFLLFVEYLRNNSDLSVIVTNLFEYMPTRENNAYEQSKDFLIAAGLAMCRMPQW